MGDSFSEEGRMAGQQALELDSFGQILQLVNEAGRWPNGPAEASIRSLIRALRRLLGAAAGRVERGADVDAAQGQPARAPLAQVALGK
jgi:hypothetical protein